MCRTDVLAFTGECICFNEDPYTGDTGAVKAEWACEHLTSLFSSSLREHCWACEHLTSLHSSSLQEDLTGVRASDVASFVASFIRPLAALKDNSRKNLDSRTLKHFCSCYEETTSMIREVRISIFPEVWIGSTTCRAVRSWRRPLRGPRDEYSLCTLCAWLRKPTCAFDLLCTYCL